MTTTHDIAKELTQARIAAHLGVGTTAVNNAVHRGQFPTKWFFRMRRLCEDAGIDCPKDLFGFMPEDDCSQNVDKVSGCQEAAE